MCFQKQNFSHLITILQICANIGAPTENNLKSVVDQPMNQPVNQQTNQSTNQRINPTNKQTLNQPTNQQTKETTFFSLTPTQPPNPSQQLRFCSRGI
jgi:hypothetical protein